MTNPVHQSEADAVEALKDELDLLGLPQPSQWRVGRLKADLRAGGVRAEPCASCVRMRRLVENLVATGVDWLDDCDAPSADIEADDADREIISEDDGVVDALTLGRALR